MDSHHHDDIVQRVRFELWRDNVVGALDLLDVASRHDLPLAAEASEIRSWLRHLDSRAAYAAAYDHYYEKVKRFTGLRRVELGLRTWSGRKTRRLVARTARHPEFLRLERELQAVEAARVLDAGCGEGRVALTVGARYPHVRVDGVEVSATNVGIARGLNRFPNVIFHHGLIEEIDGWSPPGAFDLAYAFAVLEHVRDVDEVVDTVLRALRPGGRFCFVVPMNEFAVTGPLPAFRPKDGVAGHVRVFTEAGLWERFGGEKDFVLEKIPALRWRPGIYPSAMHPTEFGSFFVAFAKA